MVNSRNVPLNSVVVQSKGNIVSDMDGEKVMLSIQKGKYYNLGEMGGRIWDLMESPISVTQLVSLLITEYEVEQAECEDQVVRFCEQLLEEDLIQIHEENRLVV